MSLPSGRSVYNMKRRKNASTITRKSSVSIIRLENGRRRTKAYGVESAVRIPSNVTRPPIPEESLQNDEISMERLAENVVIVTPQSRKTKSQNDMLNEWLTKEDLYMATMLNIDDIGLGLSCGSCNQAHKQLFRCTTCIRATNYCQICMIQMHQGMPFHRVVVWDPDSSCFRRTSLAQMGLILRVGHKNQVEACPNLSTPHGVAIIHTNGIHNLSVQFCNCASAQTKDLQLFESRIFPATTHLPQTAFTFTVLEQFRHLHLEGKSSAYTFMNTLYRLTDDTGCVEIEDRVREFRRVFRQWNYLQIKKLSGRYGHDSHSLPLAVACPACPHPGRNIPYRWTEEIPVEKHWLHRQYVHFDANFKLTLDKRTSRASGGRTLWGGEGYFVDEAEYQRYLAAADAPRREASDCVDHRALLQSSRSRFNSLEVSGIAGAVCRHECAIPQSFVNLSQGERYVNSDYGISSALGAMPGLKEVVLSYDIGCQYSKNFVERLTASPALNMPQCSLIFAIPKFHLPAHKEDCRYFYSFNYLKKVGRTDGEAIERFWSRHNFLSGSTSRMSPEARLDTLNAHFLDWNWRKLCNMGNTLENRLSDAQEQITLHQDRFTELCLTLNDDEARRWNELEDNFRPVLRERTIYQCASEEAPTQVSILQQLSDLRVPANARQDHVVPDRERAEAAIWINDGLELEDAQRLFRVQKSTVNAGSTEREHLLLNRKRTTLYDRYRAWKERSPLEEVDDLDIEPNGDDIEAEFEGIELPLPSSFADSDVEPLYSLRVLEKELRIGQAYDSLKQLRKVLGLRLALVRESRKIHGQNNNLRSHAAIKRVDSDIDFAATRYRAAHSALTSLGLGQDNETLQTLTAEDITTANVFNAERSLGRGYETSDISWIWRMRGIGAEVQGNNWLNEVLRVQFLDAKTTLDRWKEEAELCKAEMLRTAAYFRWMVAYWHNRAVHGQTPGERAHGFSMKLNFMELSNKVHARVV